MFIRIIKQRIRDAASSARLAQVDTLGFAYFSILSSKIIAVVGAL